MSGVENSNIILGVNGVEQRDHDAAAALLVNGELVAAAEQERFSRNKRSFDAAPNDAINFCLAKAGIDVAEIDAITIGWTRGGAEVADIIPEQLWRPELAEIPVVRFGHHLAHASSAYYLSPFEESAVLVVDGEGESESISIWAAGPTGLKQLHSEGVDQSLGYLYASVSRYCGFGSFGAGKIMGLAPYGEPRFLHDIEDIYAGLALTNNSTIDHQDEFIESVLSALSLRGLPPTAFEYTFDELTQRTTKQPVLEQVHKDLAASVQVFLEGKMIKYGQMAKALSGSRNLCLAGGVAMNCVANSVLENSAVFDSIYIQPACEDNGVALGSALALSGEKATLRSPNLGPGFSDKQIETFLAARRIRAEKRGDISRYAAEMVADGQVIGWFQGGMEYGPRALGGRSIVANPATDNMQARVNEAKRREAWRPFGPSVLEERAGDLFVNAVPSPYMLRSFVVRPGWRERLAAVTHVDGTTRPQTVGSQDNPRYRSLIENFAERTGIPAVLNTSFNDEKEPIVCTPDDAMRIFATTGLDALVIGSHVVRK